MHLCEKKKNIKS